MWRRLYLYHSLTALQALAGTDWQTSKHNFFCHLLSPLNFSTQEVLSPLFSPSHSSDCPDFIQLFHITRAWAGVVVKELHY